MSYGGAHIVAAPNEFRVPFPAHVGISKVQFCAEPGAQLLAVSGWDGTVHIYNVANQNNIVEKRFYFHGKPVLTCAFIGSHRIASGGLDNGVRMCDIETGRELSMTQPHLAGLRVMEYNSKNDYIVTGSWDSTIKLWDARANTSMAPVNSVATSDRVYAMDVLGDKILVGTSDRKIAIYDVRNMSQAEQSRDSPLKYQTRAVSYFPNGQAFVVSSIEGRVAVEYVNAEEQAAKKYAFKCHRGKDDGIELVFPVNAVAFHPIHSTFATGGSDAFVNLWDPFNRKRLVQLHKFQTSITSLSYNADGSQLAIASSYAYEFEENPSPMPDNTVTIRNISDAESRPK